MEEILASIRKIISEDSPDGAQPAPQPAVQALAEAEPEVLELTQEVQEEPAPAPVAPPQPVAAAHDDVVFQTIEEPKPAPAPKAADGIFSDVSRKAFDDVSSKFAQVEQPKPAPRDPVAQIAPHNGASLEALFDRAVRETFEPVLQDWMGTNTDAIMERMKPLIAEWMDKNFPPLLAAAVEAEFVRSRKAR
jgi:cell pole-organizing protein PopZ